MRPEPGGNEAREAMDKVSKLDTVLCARSIPAENEQGGLGGQGQIA